MRIVTAIKAGARDVGSGGPAPRSTKDGEVPAELTPFSVGASSGEPALCRLERGSLPSIKGLVTR